jgi:TRAP transporter TAXI family solute receptor
MTMKWALGLLAVIGSLAVAQTAAAETRVTFKSAKSASSYYQMSVQIAEAVKRFTAGEISVTVEESQGSVQNVMEAAARPGSYVFTSPPGLVQAAMKASGPFEGKGNPKFEEIRALFPIPSLTMHFVMSGESGAASFADLAGKTLLLGKGSFGASEGEKYLDLFGIKDQVEIADVELNAAVPALKNGQIDGFVTAGSYPAPNVMEAAAGDDIALISLDDEQVEATGRTRLVIPAGTYPGIDEDVVTTSLPVVAYTTSAMDEETAYTLTRAFWSEKPAMAETGAWWEGVAPAMLANVEGKFHPGALRYYDEIGVEVADSSR